MRAQRKATDLPKRKSAIHIDRETTPEENQLLHTMAKDEATDERTRRRAKAVIAFLEESRWPALAFQVSGPEHADPEIEQLSPDAWPFGLLLSSNGSAT